MASQSTNVQFSGRSHGWPRVTFHFKDWSLLGDVSAVFTGDTEDGNRVVEQSVNAVLFFPLLPIEDPFVDLEPRQPGSLLGLPSELLRDPSVALVENTH